MRRLTVTYARDEAGWWVAAVQEIPGCHTQGRSIEEAKRRIREALALFIKSPSTAKLVDEIMLPTRVKEPVTRYQVARKQAEAAKGKAAKAAKRAAGALTRDLDLGVRDAGRILDLSHQRVQQILRESPLERQHPRRRRTPTR